MAGNSFGTLFRITSFGESHGAGIGVVIDGCPPGITLDSSEIASDLARRRPGQSEFVSSRKEPDEPVILSGLLENVTTGAPIAIFIPNKDARPTDYDQLKSVFRPSHADYTYAKKYGIRDHRGAGRASARETAARVAAGSVARALLKTFGIEIIAYVRSIGPVAMSGDPGELSRKRVESNPVRCPDPETAENMMALIETIREKGDSTGGVISCQVLHCPPGLGEPVYDRLEADLAKAMLSINATKGFTIGSGFEGSRMFGSEHNDAFYKDGYEVRTRTNYSGGVQGGISNGMQIYFDVAFKPVSTIKMAQQTLDSEGKEIEISAEGRHDPCVVPRAVPIVEAMAALVIADHLLRWRAMRGKEKSV